MKRFFTFTRDDLHQIVIMVVMVTVVGALSFKAGQIKANPVAPPVPEWVDGIVAVVWTPAPGAPVAHRIYSSKDGAPWEMEFEVPRISTTEADTVVFTREPGLWSWYVTGVFVESVGDSAWTFEGPPSGVSLLSSVPVVGAPGMPTRPHWPH